MKRTYLHRNTIQRRLNTGEQYRYSPGKGEFNPSEILLKEQHYDPRGKQRFKRFVRMKSNMLFVLMLFFTSCNYPFYETTENITPTIAISSFFTIDSIMEVKIEPVVNAFSTVSDPISIKVVKVTNLKTGDEFTLNGEKGVSSIFRSTEKIPRLGDIYKIEIETDYNRPIIAIDSMPQAKPTFNIIKTGISPDANDGGIDIKQLVILTFMPNIEAETSYYELRVVVTEYGIRNIGYSPIPKRVNLTSTSNLITSEDYYPSNPVVDHQGPSSLLFRCKENNDSLTIDFTYFTSVLTTEDSLITADHDLTIEFREVSHVYFAYMTSLYKQEYSILGNDIYGTPGPVTVNSNVENGTGIFAGYTSIINTIHQESRSYPIN